MLCFMSIWNEAKIPLYWKIIDVWCCGWISFAHLLRLWLWKVHKKKLTGRTAQQEKLTSWFYCTFGDWMLGMDGITGEKERNFIVYWSGLDWYSSTTMIRVHSIQCHHCWLYWVWKLYWWINVLLVVISSCRVLYCLGFFFFLWWC